LHLSPEDIAAAEACGVSFLPASAAQVQRLAMQRKVFYQAGAPILATRGDGFFETVGTLQQLIEEGRAQQRDLAQWQAAAAAADAATPPAAAPPAAARPVAPEASPATMSEPAPEAAPAAEPEPLRAEAPQAAPHPAPDDGDAVEAAPKRPRQKRRRPAVVIPWVDPATVAPATMAPATAEPEASAAAAPEAVPTEASPDAEPVLADPLAAGKTLSLSRSTARAEEAALSAEDRGKRWLVAGAARRGRAGKHWSTRQR
jgi:hypothetical protein